MTLAEPFVANTVEEKVPPYSLPPILDESIIEVDAVKKAWPTRRAELLELFTKQVYGSYPSSPYRVEYDVFESGPSCSGKATRRQIRVVIETASGKLPIELVVFFPTGSPRPVPCFLSLNFTGNHTVIADPEIPVTTSWIRNDAANGIKDNKTFEARRNTAASRWPIDMIVANGCAVATAYYGDIDPDFDDGFENGVHGLFPEHCASKANPDRWGSVAGWAWGLSRLLDALTANVSEVDSKQVFILGHSRLGKAAIWGGVTDERFAGVISNNSGCGGAALSKRVFGETVGKINDSFPHWFCPNFHQYSLHEANLPVDQHQLLALVAPRKLYVASATEDLWADPKGEFLATESAGELYRRLGLTGLSISSFPKPNESSTGLVGYHLREGKHDIVAWDWERYVEFAKQ